MKIHSTKGEANLTELARTLFKISGPNAAAAERKAVAALRKANPQFSAAAKVPEGAPVVVPLIEGLESAPGAVSGPGFSKLAASALQAGLARASDLLRAAAARKAGEREAEDRLLKASAREIKEADDGAVKLLAAIDKAAKSRTKDFAAREKNRKQALARLAKDLDATLKLFA